MSALLSPLPPFTSSAISLSQELLTSDLEVSPGRARMRAASSLDHNDGTSSPRSLVDSLGIGTESDGSPDELETDL